MIKKYKSSCQNQSNCRLLIIGDNLELIECLIEHLDSVACNIILATTEVESFELMHNYDFALVLIVIEMSSANGYNIAKRMKNDDKISYTPFVFLAELSEDKQGLMALSNAKEVIIKGYELGAADYIFIPANPVVLKSKVSVFVEIYNQKYQLAGQSEILKKQIRQLTDLKYENKHLTDLSMIDSLTGIANKRHFDQYMDRSWKQAIRNKTPLSIIMCDIDYFKEYNDNYGHVEGDNALKLVAKTIAGSVFRQLDFVARFGGEEFVIVLPETKPKDAMYVAKRIQRNIKRLNIPHKFSLVTNQLTLSFGVTTKIPVKADKLDDFIKESDWAMYNAKNLGRNKIMVFDKIDFSNVYNGSKINRKLITDFLKNES